jgi:hypothetical protein
MQENLKDILSGLNSEVDQETLLAYLQQTLTPEKRHEIEMKLAENEFASDAADGLSEIADKQHVAHMIEMLNRDLRKKVARKKQRREKLKLKDQSVLYISILIFLALIVIAFMVIRSAGKN